jgi:hypothetical protein
METVVEIQDVVPKSIVTRRGPGTVYNVETSGGKYSTFDQVLASEAGKLKGQPAKISYKTRQNGEFTNYDLLGVEAVVENGNGLQPLQPEVEDITYAAWKASQTQAAASPPAQPSNSIEVYTNSEAKKQLSIARSVALKAAVETARGLDVGEAYAGDILHIADTYTNWLLTGVNNPFAGLDQPETAGDRKKLYQDTYEPVALTKDGSLLEGAGL